VIFFAFITVIISSIGFASLFKPILNTSGHNNFLININWFVFAFLSLCMLSVTALLQVILQGMRKPLWGQVGEKMIRPLILILFVLILYYTKRNIDLEKIVWINVISIGLTMIIAFAMYRKIIANRLSKIAPEYNFKLWVATSLTFFVTGLLYNTNSRISIFLLGIYQPKHNVGIFNIAFRISEVISFSLVIVNFVLSPLIANLYANGKMKKLQNIITRSARVTAFIGLLLTIGIVLFRKQILLLFGTDFLMGQESLVILCFGQLINIFCGSVGLLLLLTGNQRFSIYSLAGGTIINIILNVVLIPIYGINGAAIASSLGLIVWNLMMYFFVRKRLGIYPTAFELIKSNKIEKT
jgi:Membrane protein involved in the export of O-antigen and teichoic acid